MPYKNPIKRKEFKRNYYIKHREELLLKGKIYREHNEEFIKNYRKLRKIKYPWMKAWSSAKQRCNNPNSNRYYRYGARGIKFLLTKGGIKKLWFRDKAWLLKRPSLDREDNNGNYTYKNCQFIEMDKNSIKDRKKAVIQFDLNGKFIKEWESIVSASKKLSIFHISYAISGERKTAGGFRWKLKEG